ARMLTHSAGHSGTAVRAMPIGLDRPGTMVQKVFALKRPQPRTVDPQALAQVPELAPLLDVLQDKSLSDHEKQDLAAALARQMLAGAKARRNALPKAVLKEDRPGFDLPGVPRYPGALRNSSMALEDGAIQILRYT